MTRSTAGSSEERRTRDRKNSQQAAVDGQSLRTLVGRGMRGQSARRETLEVGGSNPSPRAMHRRPLLEWRRPLGRAECPFAYRWLVDTRLFSVRLHHWVGNDDLRAPHDHSWWFVTAILSGGYDDVTPDGAERLRRGSIRFRPALHRHSVRLVTPEVWSLVITGRHHRPVCFWPDGKRVKGNKWFASRGLHPCQD